MIFPLKLLSKTTVWSSHRVGDSREDSLRPGWSSCHHSEGFDQYGRVASGTQKGGRRPSRAKGADPITGLFACCVSQFLPFPAFVPVLLPAVGLLGARPFRLCAFCFQGDDPRTDLWSGNPLLLEYLRSLCYGRGICRWWDGCLFFWYSFYFVLFCRFLPPVDFFRRTPRKKFPGGRVTASYCFHAARLAMSLFRGAN